MTNATARNEIMDDRMRKEFRCPCIDCGLEISTDDNNASYEGFWSSWPNTVCASLVRCPECDRDVLQCRYCTKSLDPNCEKHNLSMKKNKRSSRSWMNRHTKRCKLLNEPTENNADLDKSNVDATIISVNGDDHLSDDDAQSIGSDAYCFTEDMRKEREIEMVTMDKTEFDLAEVYVGQFHPLDLNPIVDDEQMTIAVDQEEQNLSNGVLGYSAFNAFGQVFTPNPVTRGAKGVYWAKSQNQMYFFQKYLYKASNPDSDTGGWYGLVERSNIQDRENIMAMARPKEGRCVFRLFNLLMKMSDTGKEEMMAYQKELFDLFDLRRHDIDLATRFPTEVCEMKAFITEGTHSILKNFPVQSVFCINDHACVSLEETVRMMLGHGADPDLAYIME